MHKDLTPSCRSFRVYVERPAAASDSQVMHCGCCIIVPITSGSCNNPPVLPGYDLSSEVGPKRPTAIIVPSGEARTCLLILQLLIRELAVTPDRGTMAYENKSLTSDQ
ncbi:hypothetical protein AVEN_7899-1 [Araneus ventricosus]|uniref:Uncharacterized protein n=1 Tax=Araneus ventricosus TaxID=182803 RepID=A0A4Y2Q9D5_ARAVE|nr:hypothetical protein AVEN_7899-1 [Araneus ventricosus]